ncbi:lipopolysaccharide biosynthesis protein [Desulfobacter latus]|uniref:Oligosaccharide flippase family protein n=1 Tax=Desulfobacter latus TaxID=2292 RepID=A0A850T6R6_9BACT|nr:oligosaccharide flippase family protein [Desulfobacter latus]NWH04705.1 oligosaccharide flippase family protein [Desulfobacter latus]
MGKREAPILKNIIHYSASHYFRQFLSILTAFIRPKLLSPEYFGLWNLMKTIQTYAAYSHMGARSSMRYQIPFHLARNEKKEINQIKGAAFWGAFFINGVIALFLLFSAFLDRFDLIERIGLLSFAFIVLLQGYCEYKIALLKSYQAFKGISRANYIQYTLMFLSTICFIWFWGIIGAFFSLIFSLGIMALYFKIKAPENETLNFNPTIFIKLVRYGFPILMFNIITILIRTSDRILVSSLIGMEALGHYSIAIMILGFLMNVPGVSREIIEPKIMEQKGQRASEIWMREYFIQPAINTAYLMPLLIGGVFFFLPFFIKMVLPAYEAGIVPAHILLAGGYFLALSYTVRGVIVAMDLQLQAAWVMMIALFVNVVAGILFIRADFGISGIALGSSLSFGVLWISQLIFLCMKDLILKNLIVSHLLSLGLPFLAMLLSIELIQYICAALPITNELIAALVKLIFFFGIWLALMWIKKDTHTVMNRFSAK